MKKKKQIALIAIGLILSLYLSYQVYERWPAEKTENWKKYDSLIRIWPRLKREGIENIKVCFVFNPQTRFRGASSDDIKEMLSFRVMDANVVKWWTIYQEVPKDCLPECVTILDKTMKGMWWKWKWLITPHSCIRASCKMLIVTKKGKYIVNAGLDNSSICSSTWKSEKLNCELIDGSRFVPPKEQIISIVIFPQMEHLGPKLSVPSYNHPGRFIVIFPQTEDIRPKRSHLLDYNPVALFGDKKTTEKLFGKSLEPKMVFEGRDKLEKIVDEYNSALKEGKVLSDQYFLIFVTQDWFYWKAIYLDTNTVYDRYIASKPLKAYFDELGITKELLTR